MYSKFLSKHGVWTTYTHSAETVCSALRLSLTKSPFLNSFKINLSERWKFAVNSFWSTKLRLRVTYVDYLTAEHVTPDAT
jgi:hypothetical protein